MVPGNSKCPLDLEVMTWRRLTECRDKQASGKECSNCLYGRKSHGRRAPEQEELLWANYGGGKLTGGCKAGVKSTDSPHLRIHSVLIGKCMPSILMSQRQVFEPVINSQDVFGESNTLKTCLEANL